MNKAALNRWASRAGTTAIILLIAWGLMLVVLKQMGYEDAAMLFAWTTALPVLVLVPSAALILTILAAIAPKQKMNKPLVDSWRTLNRVFLTVFLVGIAFWSLVTAGVIVTSGGTWGALMLGAFISPIANGIAAVIGCAYAIVSSVRQRRFNWLALLVALVAPLASGVLLFVVALSV